MLLLLNFQVEFADCWVDELVDNTPHRAQRTKHARKRFEKINDLLKNKYIFFYYSNAK